MTRRSTPNMTWTAEQDLALREDIAAGLSYRQAACRLERRFNVTISRNAAIGRGARIGLRLVFVSPSPLVKTEPVKRPAKEPRTRPETVVRAARTELRLPREKIELRCAGIIPRLVALVDLENSDCRYPYGEGPYLFCGHAKQEGASYCSEHHALSIRPLHGNMGQDRPHFAALVSRAGAHRSLALKLSAISEREDATL